ncbi:MAG TPA: excinuclease ABC subunit UvrC [Microbacteriaceae bacterium]|nr:excinuclease ABC subunit UvrC [Microbacteriaceae bacterium]
MANALEWRPKTGDIPAQPGVYRFLDANGRVLYVGKAKSLRNRLTNYFAPLSSLHERTRRMVMTARDVTWTVVRSEVEALQLEFLWINEFDPPFNVQFRDDKSYPYLAVLLADEAPRVIVTRRKGIPGAKYFGPYPQVSTVYETLSLLRTLYPMRTCKDSDYRKAMQTGKPCFASQIGKCHGPCSQRVTVEEHRQMAQRFVQFMNSQDRRLLGDLQNQMVAAAAAQEYERAAKLRDQLQAATTFFERSAIVLRDGVDSDVYGIAHDGLSAAVQLFVVRGGVIRGVRGWTVNTELDVSAGELVETVLQHSYIDPDDIPAPEILVPERPDSAGALEAWLSERAGRKVIVKTAQRGEKASLMATAQHNANHALLLYKNKRISDFTTRSQALEDLQSALALREAPLRIECVDVSHLQGTNIVASLVVFEDGLPRKDQYRRYNIAQARDDTDAIAQVLSRRFARLDEGDAESESGELPAAKRFAYRPNLLLVDGGEPQVNAAERARIEAGSPDIAIVGIAKRLEELWLPGESFPVILPRNSEALFLIQRARDEAHRFAITHQRARRKRDVTTVLNDIPGLGPSRVSALLAEFGSVKRLRAASLEDIAGVSGIGPVLAATIHAALADANA